MPRMSPKGSIFRMFNPGKRAKEEDAVEKRREQLRRAQQCVIQLIPNLPPYYVNVSDGNRHVDAS